MAGLALALRLPFSHTLPPPPPHARRAKSGHPGAPMGCAPIAHVLFGKVMRYDPKSPKWAGRDRFVLSNGHASALLYSMLHLTGYDLPMEQLQVRWAFGRGPRLRKQSLGRQRGAPWPRQQRTPASRCAPPPLPSYLPPPSSPLPRNSASCTL